jgi:hypothetical protein
LFGGGGTTVKYDPESAFFKVHASKGKTFHNGVVQNYLVKIKDSEDLEQYFRDKNTTATQLMQALLDKKEDLVRLAREASSEITLKAGQIEDNTNDLLQQQNETEKRQIMYAISKDIVGKKAMPCRYMAKASQAVAQEYAGLSTEEDWKPKADLISAKMILLENTGFAYSDNCPQKNWSLFRGRGIGTQQQSGDFKVYCQGIVGFKNGRAVSSSSSVDVFLQQTRDRLFHDACNPSLSKSKRVKAKRQMDALMEVYDEDDDEEDGEKNSKRQKTTGEEDIADPKTTGEEAIAGPKTAFQDKINE